jgi:MFS family permease
MNLDDVMEGWRSHDASTFYGVDKTLLHQALRQEQATLEKQQRWARRGGYVGSAALLITAGLFFAIMIDPNQPPTFAARLSVWDYVVGVVGVAAAVTIAGAVFALRRSHQARERGFGDSLRDHLRRRIAQLDDEATVERRLGFIALVAGLIAAAAISIVSDRIKHVPVPWSEIDWPSPFAIVLILGFFYLLLFRWMPRERQRYLSRKRQLETLLKELDG